MDDSNGLIPIIAIFFVFGAPIAAWIVSRVLAHNEYMAMISHGITPPPDPRAWRRARKYGWVPPPGAPGDTWGAPPPPPAGYANVPPPDQYGQYGAYYHAYAQRRLSRGIMVAMVGLALYLGLGFLDDAHGFGGPSIPGLIVMFVGLAQVISAVLAGATIGAPATPVGGPPPSNAGQGPFGPPSQDVPPPAGPPYGWRPGDVTPIEKPAGPPDPR